MTQFENIVQGLDYNELMRFKRDIDKGAVNSKRIIERVIKERLKEHEKICATCSNDLQFYSQSNYTLIFGSDDFKRKASFCGVDCLQYFLRHFKKEKKGEAHAENV